jgi:hypothetical protein
MEALITRTEIHHAIPQYLLRLRDKADAAPLDGEGIEFALEFEYEAICYSVDPDISRDDLAALIDASTAVMERSAHRGAPPTRRTSSGGGVEAASRPSRGTDGRGLGP